MGSMRLGDKLIQLRRERGYSQEQLANMLDISRQSVSKWEADQSIPEISELIMISDIFNVSVDSLLREDIEILPLDKRHEKLEAANNSNIVSDNYSSRAYGYGFYEYKSKIKVFGIPLVHVKTGYGIQVAKGIIAIGNISIGVISMGGISIGGLCLGGIGLGLLAFAGLALGGIAIGGGAIGILAFGGMAIGMYSIGGVALASEIAVGGLANGKTAIGSLAKGENLLKVADIVREGQVKDFVLQHHPNIWRPLLKIMAFIAEMSALT
ncbi:MAG: helix-turn-helix transcriptional regulator [Clostridiales bacterium]|jgi:transcriptional regulator with XRE-family HTH domain|nr:helix-turn-helix transcriptional regulator [Clostridiales bacterium]